MNILLVDDDDGSLEGMQTALHMLKHTCDAYCDPCEAIKNYPNRTYDLIMTDVYMPSMNGFAMVQKLREVNSQTIVIFMSGQATAMQQGNMRVDTKNFFLCKPIDFFLLKELLERIHC